jgi:hypothetical protein
MKFKSKIEKGVEHIWHEGKKKIIFNAKVENGIFETVSEEVIEDLVELGYEEAKDLEEPKEILPSEPKEETPARAKKGKK